MRVRTCHEWTRQFYGPDTICACGGRHGLQIPEFQEMRLNLQTHLNVANVPNLMKLYAFRARTHLPRVDG